MLMCDVGESWIQASSTKSYQGLSPEQVTQYDQGLISDPATEGEGEGDEWVDTRIPITLVSGFLGKSSCPEWIRTSSRGGRGWVKAWR